MSEAPRGISWLASYPKSGNTWLRMVLRSVHGDGCEPDINTSLQVESISSSRHWFDTITGIASSDLSEHAIDTLRPAVFRALAAEPAVPTMYKSHESYRRTDTGDWLFPPEASAGAVYLVRDPRDVALSFAAHLGKDVDATIAVMNDDDYCLAPKGTGTQLRQHVGSWSDNLRSWLDAPIPKLVVRFEDMLSSPAESFRTVLDFLSISASDDVLENAVEACRFQRLQEQERAEGFFERPRRSTAFFRHGVAGGWREGLTPEQAASIESKHAAAMREFGYL